MPGGRPRWRSFSKRWATPGRTRGSSSWRRSSTWRTSSYTTHAPERVHEMTTFQAVSPQLEALAIEVPSWAYGNSGTRFKVFGSAGTPRTVEEKIADAATVHRFTGLAPTVALHIPWDYVDDFGKLRAYADDLGVGLGTINSNTFQDDDYKLGSLTSADPKVRQKAVEHNLECIEVMNQTG